MKLDMIVTRRVWRVRWPDNISQAKLAAALGLPPMTVHQWFAKETIPDRYVDAVKKIPMKDVLKEKTNENERASDKP